MSNCFARGPTVSVWALFALVRLTSMAAQPLVWEQHEGYRDMALAVRGNGQPGFTLLRPEQTGIFFTNTLSYARSEANQTLMNGSGVAAGDFDGDGLADLYFASSEGGNGLFRNLGDWRFADVTRGAGVAAENQSSKGVVFADIDGDGRLDLLINALGGPNACFRNLGNGQFTNVTAASGISAKTGGHSIALADVDGDGDLDLYLVNYGEYSILRSGGQISMRTVNGRPTVAGRWAKRLKLIGTRLIELGEPDALYLNNGRGVFTPVPWTGGAFLNADGSPLKSDPMDMGLSAMFRDINGDGAPDLYVCNDFQSPDRIWINDGRGRFRALPDLAVRTVCHFSMGVDFADIDRDGHDDFFAGDMLSRSHALRMRQMGSTNPPPEEVTETWDRRQARRNTLNVARGDGTYADLANFAGVDASDWTWSVVFLDVDLDGFEDLLAVNAHAYDTQDLDMQDRAPAAQGSGMNRQIGTSLRSFPPLITPNYAFHNRRDRRFIETGDAWGFNSTNVSHGIALADFDNDGDLDLAVSCLWQPPLLYRNESTAPRVAVRLKGRAPNTKGIGARVRLRGGAVPEQTQEIQAGGRYLSADEPMRTFAAGPDARAMSLEVRWRSGHVSIIHGVRPNRLYEIDETGAQPAAPASASPTRPAAATKPIFRDVSSTLPHSHAENLFDEGSRQPLLYRALTRIGPGVAWIDLDHDGHDELVIGGNLGSPIGVYRLEAGSWQAWRPAGWPVTWPFDATGLAAWTPSAVDHSLITAASPYRLGQEHARALTQLPGSSSTKNLPTPWQELATLNLEQTAPGPIAVADYDGDGDLDVFIGGRFRPGRFPEAATSVLLRNLSGKLSPDPTIEPALKGLGLVTSAVWSDLNDDGWPELILGCEWGPIRIFANTRGRLSEATEPWGLTSQTGWWQGVATGDIDGDGHLDIVAANWGWNSSYHQPSPQTPAVLFYGDLDDNGTWDLIETEYANGRLWPRRNLATLGEYMPWLRLKFSSHRAFAEADIPALLDQHRTKARRLDAATFASTVFFNRNGRFVPVSLPDEAQYAPAYAVNIADADGDGQEDVFLSQNCFALRSDEPRLDAGLGLWLRGVGLAPSYPPSGLQPISAKHSGVRVYGEQRGAAVGDFDGDGRIDLVVTQNDGPTVLFKNEAAQPGLRVRLAGPAGNPSGIGARLRLKFADRTGPPREIKGGGGYWSQDSLVAVMATPTIPDSIEIRWPGGTVTSGKIPAGAREIKVALDGSITATPVGK